MAFIRHASEKPTLRDEKQEYQNIKTWRPKLGRR